MRYLFKNFLLEYVPATPLRVFLKDILGTKLAHLAYTQPGRKVALSVQSFDIHDLKLVQSYITAIITVQNATLVAIWLRISR